MCPAEWPTEVKHQLRTVDGQAVKTRTEMAARKLITASARKREGKLKGQFDDYTRDSAYRPQLNEFTDTAIVLDVVPLTRQLRAGMERANS